MDYISVKDWAAAHGVSERTARNYCAHGKIEGACLIGKTWSIPADALFPAHGKHKSEMPLLTVLRREMEAKLKGGLYHRVQIDLTYNSNHIEGSRLTHDQTRFIFETNTIGISDEAINIDDIIETSNHFQAVDLIISDTQTKLTETFIKRLHCILKSGTSDERKQWFRVGEYKKLPNEVGGNETTPPEDVAEELKALLKSYNEIPSPTLEDIIDFHHRFESIHPFQDGNGRVGRLIMFWQCLQAGIVPFIISDRFKMFYYNGLRNWPSIKGYLMDTCLTAQDNFKLLLDKFRIPYTD